jgi:hypothetical protein
MKRKLIKANDLAQAATDPNGFDKLDFKEQLDSLTAYELSWLNFYMGEAAFNAARAEEMTGREHSSRNALRVNAHKTLQRLHPVIKRLLEGMGISELSVKVKLVQKLHAKETKFFTYKGKVITQVDVDDHAIQLKATELIGKALGMFNGKIPEDLDRLLEIELAKITALLEGKVSG